MITKEGAARARVLKGAGEDARYDVSPVEIVAAFQIPLEDGRGVLDEDRVTEAAARAAGLAYRKIDPLKLDMALATRTVSRPYAQKHVLLPLERTEQGRLRGGGGQPVRPRALREPPPARRRCRSSRCSPRRRTSSRPSRTSTASRRRWRAPRTTSRDARPQVANFEQLVSLSGTQELEASDKPVVQAVDYLLRYAFDNRASDIHIEPKRDTRWCACASTACCTPSTRCPRRCTRPIVSRIKMLSRMDISEKRRPQDGRIKTERDGREVELRVSTLPTAFGEKVVIRIFDPETLVQDIAQLGFEPRREGALRVLD